MTDSGLRVGMVEARGLSRRFGDLTAVDQLNLSIGQGEVFGLLGPNGAGKSTVIKMLTTLLPPTEGTALVAGFEIRQQSARVRTRIAYVPQLVSADGALTAEENLRLFGKLHGVPRHDLGRRVAEALDFVGLTTSAKRVARTYSGGMVRRLEIAIALIHRPLVLFLDEPTVGLDPLARQSVWKQVRALVKDLGMTILLTTHFMEEADELCDRVAIMNRGRVATVGKPSDLKAGLDKKDADLDDVFAHYSGRQLEGDGNFRDIAKGRRSIARLG